jgi:flagellum-specific peptidoglycan hydrolase FlgJ
MTKLTTYYKENLKLVKQAAYNVYGNDRIQADLAIAQAILESDLDESMKKHRGRGGSGLAIDHCNLFGQKPSRTIPELKEGTNGVVDLGTNEYIKGKWIKESQPFLSNNDLEDSFRQRKTLLEKLSRYKDVLEAKTVEEGAEALQKGGWATDPAYTKGLLTKYERHVK